MEKFSKAKWIKFAQETALNDGLEDEPDFKEFGVLMERVYRTDGSIESVLWEGANPSGTEDRTWVRVYLYMKGYKQYARILSSLDGAHAKRIKKRFDKVRILPQPK